MDMWCDIYCADDTMITLGGPRNFDCINDYGKDLIPILGYIDSSKEEFKRNLALTRRMLDVDCGLGHQDFSIVMGMASSSARNVLPLVFATQVYRLWYNLFEDAANYYYKFERRRGIRDRSPKDSGGAI